MCTHAHSYRQKTVYPAPEHRSAAFSQQASMVYVILHFTPDTMSRNRSLMREVVSKHFNDNWVVPLYMGRVVDLVVEWEPYPAAHEALQDEALRVRRISPHHTRPPCTLSPHPCVVASARHHSAAAPTTPANVCEVGAPPRTPANGGRVE